VDLPKPIRFDRDTWLIMRTDPVLPKAVIQRFRDRRGTDHYLLVKWDLEPGERVLMGVYASLEKANSMVLYDLPAQNPDGPKGTRAFGAYSGAR
jgi:hypothetical protein